MSEIEKGMISEEALDQVAGGLNIDKSKFIKSLEIAGVVVAGAGAVGTAGFGVYKLGEKKGHNEGHEEGYDKGHEEGYWEGRKEGKDRGFILGEKVGHMNGYREYLEKLRKEHQ